MLQSKSYLLALTFVLTAASFAVADLPSKINIGGQTLQLNGAGARTKTFVQIYEGGLYLATPTSDAKAIVAADEWMAIRIRITSGFVSRASLVASLQDSLKKSTGGKTAAIAKETEQFMASLDGDVKKNDVYDFIQVPGKGLYVLKNGGVKTTIQSMPFKKALFGIWLSDAPVDKSLRQAMLAGPKRH